MRRSIKTYVMILLAAAFVFTAFISPSDASVEAETTWTAWPSTIYYMARLNGPSAPYSGDVEIYITAVDKYKLWINGNRVSGKAVDEYDGADSLWQTVEHYTVSAPGNNIDVAVEVQNDGVGNGNGLMVDIVAGSDWLGTTTMKRRSEDVAGTLKLYDVLWYYYDGDITDIFATNWFATGPTKLADNNITAKLKQVIAGKMGDGTVSIDHNPDPHIEYVSGFVGNVDTGSAVGGGIKLRRIEGENIALGRPAEMDKLTDGDTLVGLPYNKTPINSSFRIDLQDIYRVNRYVMYTGGKDPQEWATKKSVRGFSVEISFDELRWEEVNVINEIGVTNKDNGGFDYASVEFPDEWARYIRYVITEARQEPPHVGEIMVYGVGYVFEGEYESDWIDFGDLTVGKNIDTVEWDADVPEGTSLVLQTMSTSMKPGGTVGDSFWSTEVKYSEKVKSIRFESPEPATRVKYRIKMTTQDIDKTPVLKSLKFTYSQDDLLVSSADGYIWPVEVPMGKETTFDYNISYELLSGQNLKSLAIAVPGFSSVNYVYSNDLDDTLYVGDGLTFNSAVDSKIDTLYVNLSSAIDGSIDANGSSVDSLNVNFNTTLLKSAHKFQVYLFNSSMNDNYGGIKAWENKDLGSTTIMASNIIDGVLSDVNAIPKVFTPNGDGVNDFTVVEFMLAKVNTDVQILIYDTKGSLVATIFDEKLDASTYYIPNKASAGAAAAAVSMPGYWDGKDEDGDLVPPGVYFYQVVANTDDGKKAKGGTVVVGY